jgi:hypothetical protein
LVTFVLDGTATNPISDPAAPAGQSIDEMLADPLTLTVDEVMNRTRYVLAGRFAAVSSIADLLERYDAAPG